MDLNLIRSAKLSYFCLPITLLFLGMPVSGSSCVSTGSYSCEALQDARSEAEMAFQKGMQLLKKGDRKSLEDATPELELAARVWKMLGERQDEAFALFNLGTVYSDLGDTAKGFEKYSAALPLWRAIGNADGEVKTLIFIGSIYARTNEPQKALDQYTQALKLCKASGNREDEAAALDNMGKIYFEVGENELAFDKFENALRLRVAAKNRGGQATTLINIAAVYDAMDRKQDALTTLSGAFKIATELGDVRLETSTINAIAKVFSDSGDKTKALEYYTQVLSVVRARGYRDEEAATLNNMGKIYADLGKKAEALDLYNQALSLCRALGNHGREARTLANRSVVERNQKDFAAALTDISDSLKIVESLRFRISGDELRSSYFSTISGYYEYYIDLLETLHDLNPTAGYDKLALEASERQRARTLIETLSESHTNIRSDLDPTLVAKERTLQEHLNELSASFVRLRDRALTEEQEKAAQKEIADVLADYQEVTAKIRRLNPHYAGLTQPETLSSNEIQKQVEDADTLFLEYSLGRNHSFLWAVTSSSISTFTLPPREEIETKARDWYSSLSDADTSRSEQVRRLALALSEILLEPVASQLNRRRIVITADGILNYLPFSALPVPLTGASGSTKQSLLLAGHEIIYVPSVSTLAILRREASQHKRPKKILAAMADPVFSSDDERVRKPAGLTSHSRPLGYNDLGAKTGDSQHYDLGEGPQATLSQALAESRSNRRSGRTRLRSTRQEVSSIALLVPRNLRLVNFDFSASKANAVSGVLSEFRILHFATHGLLDSQHPELSGVVLSMVDEQGSPVDGFLRLHDIFNLTLPADLVVLSACQTGLGKEVHGEGLIGVTRGFMYAGAPRVVVSLWEVDDIATAELMRRFYAAMLKRRLRPAAALKIAQTSMSTDPHWSAPYYWAGFVLQGE